MKSLPGIVGAFALAFLAAALNAAEPRPAARPNIILMMADDMGWGDPGFNGNTIIRTPQLDAMARAGLRFERFYSGAPVCSPTRGSCLTGRHPYRYGIWSANEGHLRSEEITLAEALKSQGYATGHFGKWHLGTLDPVRTIKGATRNPLRNYATPGMNGFDEWFSTESSVRTWDPMQDNTLNPYYHNGVIETENLDGCDSRVLMDRAIPFIRQAAGARTPFLAVIWFHAPHGPVVAGPEFRRMYADRDEGEQHFYGAITALDVQVGRLRQELRALGIAENTLLWFASDNGPEGDTGSEGAYRGTAGPFRGRKRSLWEGGVRVPGLLEWPGRIKPGTTTDVACSMLDYFPTVLDLLGFKMKGQPEPIDGISLLPLFDGRMKERPVPIPFETLGGTGTKASRGSPRMALVDNRYKLLTDMDAKPDGDLLFDLLADRGETTNVAAQHGDLVQAMKARLVAFRESCKRSLAGLDYAVPFTPDKNDVHPSEPGFARALRSAAATDEEKSAGPRAAKRASRVSATPTAASPTRVALQNDDSGVVTLAAAAAVLHGRLTYRADQDKIGQWASADDWIEWELEVRQPGEFEVEVSCGQTEDGSVYEIAAGGQTLRSTVAASGSYRTAKAQIAGSLRLEKAGRYTLAVRPVSKRGAVVMTLWKIDLIPVKK